MSYIMILILNYITMKAEKINELIWWAEWKNIKRDIDIECLSMYQECSNDLFEWELAFDIVDNDTDSNYIICSYYANIEGKEWFSAIINRDCLWWFNTPEEFASYMAKLYDRAMEIQSYFNS